jgi:hypothetical protein
MALVQGSPGKYIPPSLRNRLQRQSADVEPVALQNLVTLKYEDHQRPFASFLEQVNEGLNVYPPEPCEEGVNGTYFLKSKNGSIIAIFKPNDEEGDAVNNPKHHDSPSPSTFGSVRKGIKPGEAAHREIAAYLLDDESFFGVPKTTLVSIEHPSFFNAKNPSTSSKTKFGSLQQYMANNGASWDVAPKTFPVKELHKIGILDIMILNSDRHGGNILYKGSKEEGYTLIPIDHSYSLPHSMEHAWFDWFYWDQAKQPFDQDTLTFISKIDIEQKCKVLKALGIPLDSIRIFKLCTTILKTMAANNCTLFDIASVVCRIDLRKPSTLEIICQDIEKEMRDIEMKENLEGGLDYQEKEVLFMSIFKSRIDKLSVQH